MGKHNKLHKGHGARSGPPLKISTVSSAAARSQLTALLSMTLHPNNNSIILKEKYLIE